FLYNFIIEKSGCGASSGCIEEVYSIIIGIIIFLLLLFVKYIILKLSRKSKKYIIISFSWIFLLIIIVSSIGYINGKFEEKKSNLDNIERGISNDFNIKIN
ncbi:hypothetical protein EOM39_07760, partial [Candidatus Gracilibacteria bacterium]|nr:hypothetical protein [Candidatus Gracilibacteria bacterium]